ncbi:hypothetical protein OZX68_01155 [Streptococcaceae bacterium ESL0729]|nr:hypothetical protein OZX68_01155 [Streptococcaceae bacterium ESL0729]
MAQIEQYTKNGRKLYKVKNLYIGRDDVTYKKKYKSKSGFKTKTETNR